MSICSIIYLISRKINNLREKILCSGIKKQMGYIASTASFAYPDRCLCPSKMYFHDFTHTSGHDKYIISPIGDAGRFIMKKYSGAAEGLTVITGSHPRIPGQCFKDEQGLCHPNQIINKDVIVEEEVMIGANVTITSGVVIGRGASIGGGSVIRQSIPPYSIVIGNPAKVVGFAFTPEEIIEHEKMLYPENERLPLNLLEKNYNKYFLSKLNDIKELNKI